MLDGRRGRGGADWEGHGGRGVLRLAATVEERGAPLHHCDQGAGPTLELAPGQPQEVGVTDGPAGEDLLHKAVEHEGVVAVGLVVRWQVAACVAVGATGREAIALGTEDELVEGCGRHRTRAETQQVEGAQGRLVADDRHRTALRGLRSSLLRPSTQEQCHQVSPHERLGTALLNDGVEGTEERGGGLAQGTVGPRCTKQSRTHQLPLAPQLQRLEHVPQADDVTVVSLFRHGCQGQPPEAVGCGIGLDGGSRTSEQRLRRVDVGVDGRLAPGVLQRIRC
mmetsp:Transcript_150298/g.418775  ORF Transcript_150298/g.418775 Transcript_150298/m.418775 type:complete len:280 (-) Transcript_150298:970-1809(-)